MRENNYPCRYYLLVLSVVCLFTGTISVYASDQANRRVTIDLHNAPIKTFFEEIKKQTGLNFVYNTEQTQSLELITVKATDEPLEAVLQRVFAPIGFSYKLSGNIITIRKSEEVRPQPTPSPQTEDARQARILKGIVYDDFGETLPGVNIWVVGTRRGTISDENGAYTLELPTDIGNPTLKFTFVGMEPQDIVIRGESFLEVTLETAHTSLQAVEVVSTGYQQTPKDRSTGSFGYIDSEELAKVPSSPNVLQRLEGKIPGLQVKLTSGDRNFNYATTVKSINSSTRTVGSTEYDIQIRGESTYNGEKMPLIVIDGTITEMDLSNINPSDIENITVLKDAAAASIWGVRAANGVIVITTKRGQAGTSPRISFSSSLTITGKPDINYMKMMSSAEMLDYEKELVDKGIVTSAVLDHSSYYAAQNYMPEGTMLALRLKEGLITQQQYDTRVAALSQIDNRSQIADYLLQGAKSQQYNLSVNGGTEKSGYFYSASYSNEEPSYVRESASRLTLLLNNHWKLFDWARLTSSFKGTFFTYNKNGMSVGSLYSSKRIVMPYELLADENGNSISYDQYNPEWTSGLSSVYKDWTYSYLDELNNADNTQKTGNYSGSINVEIPLFKGLSSNTLFYMEKSYTRVQKYENQETFRVRNLLNYYTHPDATSNSLGITNGGIMYKSNTEENNYTIRQQFDYNLNTEDHRVYALAGTEMRETNMEQSLFSLFGYNQETGISNTYINYSYQPTYAYVAGATPTSYTTFNGGGYPSTAEKRRRFLSYYGNASYTYLNRYTISGSVRYDDYNNFGVDRKYRAIPLYSFGGKWNADREHFMESYDWIDNLALRATYGINGNLSLNTYPFTYIGLNSSNDPTTGQSSAFLVALANPQLRWEKVYTANVGIDFSFLGKLNGSIDYYNKRSRDLLYNLPTSTAYIGTVGNGYIQRNGVSINGKGLDANLNATVYSNKDWEANIGAAFSYNTNEVVENKFLNADNYVNYFGYYPIGIGLIEGYPTSKLLVYRFAGLDENGLTQIYDENGEIIKATTTSITSFGVLKDAGRTVAPYYGNVNVTLNYKQFSLYALATYQFGSVFLKPAMTNYLTSIYMNQGLRPEAAIAQRWRESGDEATTNVPALSTNTYSTNRYIYSDINVLSGDYIRLRQISLTYDLPAGIAKKVLAETLRMSLSIQNPGLLWTANKEGYDPDFTANIGSNYNLPAARSYTLSFNVNF